PGIFSQTTNVTVLEGQVARFSVLVTNRSPVTYQWSAGGQNLNGATNSALAISNETVSANNNQVYRCAITNAAGFALSANIPLTVLADTNPPTVIRVVNVGTTNLQVVYSELVEAASATNTFNYALQG